MRVLKQLTLYGCRKKRYNTLRFCGRERDMKRTNDLGRDPVFKLVCRLAIPHLYATSGPYDQILKKYGLDAEGIFQSVKQFLG